MKHKAPCSSRGYSGLWESGPLNIDGGRWWRCWWRSRWWWWPPAAFRRHRKQGGEIHYSDWGESFAQIFLIKLAFLRQKESVNRLTVGSRGSGARLGGRAPPLPRAHLRYRFALILLPENHKCSKKISVRFYPVWTPFDIGFLRNKKHATDRNWHWALDQYVSPKNSIKSCQKVYGSCRILAWNNQKL